LISAGMKHRNKKKFRYGIPAHFEHCPGEKRGLGVTLNTHPI
jgi:hypothetical protein